MSDSIQNTESGEIFPPKKNNVKIAIGSLFVFAFAVGAIFSAEYFKAPPTPQAAALSAAALESLQAKTAFTNISLHAQGALVADIDTGAVLYEKNPDTQLPLASLTKVPLVLVVSEVLQPESIITIGHDTSYNSKASQLLTGERWKTSDLISYTLVASSNDGAQILADAAEEAMQAKYREAEAPAVQWRMNDLAKSLNMHSTYFLNPTGLDISETQSGAYGSARDMAKLFSYAAKTEPLLFEKTATSSIRITSLDGQTAYAENTDAALDQIPGMIMGKTGLTDLAGGNLAVVFAANGKRYVAVALGSTETGRFTDIQQLTLATRSIQSQ
jgi:D-alanyl-D-alanine carboxypeptidase (penicillin-binding protein 5/6)